MSVPADEPGNPAHAIFERFLHAGECREVLGCFVELCQQLGLQGSGLQLYHGLKAALNYWNAKALWSKLDKKAGHKDYDQGTACAGTKVPGVWGEGFGSLPALCPCLQGENIPWDTLAVIPGGCRMCQAGGRWSLMGQDVN